MNSLEEKFNEIVMQKVLDENLAETEQASRSIPELLLLVVVNSIGLCFTVPFHGFVIHKLTSWLFPNNFLITPPSVSLASCLVLIWLVFYSWTLEYDKNKKRRSFNESLGETLGIIISRLMFAGLLLWIGWVIRWFLN